MEEKKHVLRMSSESVRIIGILSVVMQGAAEPGDLRTRLSNLVDGSVLQESIVRGDFNDDGRSDYAAVIRTGDFSMQKLLIAAGEPDNTLQVELLEDAFTEPGAGGTLGVLPTLSWDEPLLKTTEMGGSSSGGWRYEFHVGFTGDRFAFSRSMISRENRNIGSFFSRETDYETLLSIRTVGRSSTQKPAEVKYFNLVSSKIPPGSHEHGTVGSRAWSEATPLTVGAERFLVFDKGKYGGNADLSATVRTLWTNETLYFQVAVTDDRVVLQPDETIAIHYDHVEIWFDEGEVQQSYVPRNEPDSQVTTQLGFFPREGSRNIGCCMLYPEEKQIPEAAGTYTRLPGGYMVEVRLPRDRFTFAESPCMRTQSVKYLGCTVVVSDSDNAAGPEQETMIATSQFTWGNPFSMGRLHLFEDYGRPCFPDYGF